MVPNHKMGNLAVCGNYHTITLLINPSKILLHIIWIENFLAEEQVGFIPKIDTVEQIFNLHDYDLHGYDRKC